MCGFVAVLGPGGPLPLQVLEQMRDRLAHRGPDGSGAWTGQHAQGSISFGFRRLAILDTRSAADQPMVSDDGRKVIVFNGEIYNFVELRAELEGAGRRFRTRCDTEVLLQAYECWGDAMVGRLNGMFAFVIWDGARGQALVARDRFGEKPLFMCRLPGGQLAFASEIKALLAYPGIDTSCDMEMLGQVLSGQLIYGMEQTLFTQVRQFKAAHRMVVDAGGAIHGYSRYWAPTYDRSLGELGQKELAGEFLQRLEKAAHMRMRSDVPVTACLSGGLDSSSLVALLSRRQPASTDARLAEAISVRFPDDPTIDEGPHIDRMLQWTSLNGHSVMPSATDLVRDIRRLHWHHETIVAGPSMYLEWSLMREARALGYKVIIDGQGADEVLAGYQNYFQAMQAEHFSTGPAGWFDAWWSGWQRDRRLRHLSRQYDNPSRRFARSDSLGLRDMLRYRKSRAAALAGRYDSEGVPDAGSVGLLRFELAMNLLRISLPSNVYSGDRNSMAHGIECRYPFLDYELVDFATRLPDRAYIDKGWSKYILRSALAGLLPDAIRWRVDKVGFAAPQDAWLAGDEMRKWLDARLHDPRLSGIPGHDSSKIEGLWRRHREGRENNSGILWKWASAAELIDMAAAGEWKAVRT